MRRFITQDYWAKPLPGFGDPKAQLFIIGLAPAAHGGNRTGRISCFYLELDSKVQTTKDHSKENESNGIHYRWNTAQIE